MKAAYHHALMHFHPDKKANSSKFKPDDLNTPDTYPHFTTADSIPIYLVKEAYDTLSMPDPRARYDTLLLRPAQVASLGDFQEDPDPGDDSGSEGGLWRYKYR